MAINPELIYPSGRPYTPYQPTAGAAPSWQRVTDIPSLTTYPQTTQYPTTSQYAGLQPYTPTRTVPSASSPTYTSYAPTTRAPSYAPTTRAPSYSTASRAAAPIPYGSMSTWRPGEGEMPTMGELPEYATPEVDRARISELTELGMGAPMGKLREGLMGALRESRYSDNPMVRAMARKKALAGYGTGIR